MSHEVESLSPSETKPALLRGGLWGLAATAWSLTAVSMAPPGEAAQSDSTNAPVVIEGHPLSLKNQDRITMETNAPPTAAATNNIAPKAKSFFWQTTWQGWDGLHTEVSQKTHFRGPLEEWRTDLGLTNAYRAFQLEELKTSGKVGAKLAVDGAAYVTSKQFQDFDDGVEVRRARLYATGDCLFIMPVSYWLEVGYIPNQVYLEEDYLSFPLPYIGQLKLGQYQAPMGLDVITSSRDVTFMEPASPIQALAPGTSAGLQIGRPVFDQRGTWAFGLFTEGLSTDFGEATKDYGRAITRITALPMDRSAVESPQFLHLGLSANLVYSASSSVRYRSRPESHLAPYVVDTGEINADGALAIGGEIGWVNGPFSIQSEIIHSLVQQNVLETNCLNSVCMTTSDLQTLGFSGFYVSTSWFLTGESRPYDRNQGQFTRVIPKHNFDWGRGGWGAWEIAGRYSMVNLKSGEVHGGRLRMMSAGVNWYLHSHVKWRFDYGFGHVDGRAPDGNINVFQSRMELDF